MMRKLICFLLGGCHQHQDVVDTLRTNEVKGAWRVIFEIRQCRVCKEFEQRKCAGIDEAQYPGGLLEWFRRVPEGKFYDEERLKTPVAPDLTELREYHAKAVKELEHYADDSGLRESDVKHYRKRAEFHRRQVELLDGLK